MPARMDSIEGCLGIGTFRVSCSELRKVAHRRLFRHQPHRGYSLGIYEAPKARQLVGHLRVPVVCLIPKRTECRPVLGR
jgi:hypothetical protein